jgi:hypothetical protein
MKKLTDKQKHVLWGFLLSWVGLIATANGILAGIIGGFFWGCLKECVDKWGWFLQPKTGWNWADVGYTALGGLIIGLLLYLTGLDEYLKTTPYLFG